MNPAALLSARRLTAIAPFALAVLLYAVTALLLPGYASLGSLRSLLLLSSLLGIASFGQTLCIIMGGVDLSVPAVIGFADVMFVILYGHGTPAWAAIVIILVAATAIGLINAFVSRLLSVNSLIVTLATGTIILGAIWASTHGNMFGTLPEWLVNMVSVVGTTGPIPIPGAVTLWVVLSAIGIFIERRTVLGRWTYAMGANPHAAVLAHVPTMRTWATVFAISAVLSAVAGILLAGFSGAADPSVGDAYLFTTLSAVVIGGTPLIGGRGGYARTIAGCFIITELTMLLIGLGLDVPAQQVCLGALIIILVGVYGREPHISMQI
jgi:ribose transport system permease protein